MARADDIHRLCHLVGNNVARVIDARDGWPGLIELQLSTGPKQYSLHVGPIHSMARNKPYELRFQNPGQNRPVRTLPGTLPLLVGIWNDDAPPVLVAGQPENRLGDITRFSCLFHDRIIRAAQQAGWAEPYKNNSGDLYWAFFPQLLPTFAEMYESEIAGALQSQDIQIAVVGAGLVDDPAEASATRARHAATILVRDAKFRRSVIEAYNRRCAMCGLNLGLVSGAHILPVSAPGSIDQPTNGLALCDNHHRAFDSHRIWVRPADRTLKIHPKIIEHAAQDARSNNFLTTTFGQLSDPVDPVHTPEPRMFDECYDYFKGYYDWVA